MDKRAARGMIGAVITTTAIVYALVGLAVLYPLIGVHGWMIAFHLLTSRRVLVREYRSADLAPAEILTEVTLEREAVFRLALLFMSPRGFPVFKKCLFEPHHQIEIADARGGLRKITICFGCDYLTSQSSKQMLVGPLHNLGARAKTLKHWMQAHSIPVRPEVYVWSGSPNPQRKVSEPSSTVAL